MFFQNKKIRGVIYQIALLVGVIAFFMVARNNLVDNLAQRNIATGFEFLSYESSFDIYESPIEYDASHSYGRAFIVGILNTLKVTLLGSIMAISLGVIVGIFLLSKNWILRNTSYFYVNAIRNTPLILQLLFWYMILTEFVPHPRDATSFLGSFLTNRGLYYPAIIQEPFHLISLVLLGIAILLSFFVFRYGRKVQENTGKQIPVYKISLLLILLSVLVPWAFSGFTFKMEYPEFGTFDINYGNNISPEYFTILFGLVVYTASFIAEVVRSGIVAISRGQTEAGLAIGLSRGHLLRLVILPQAMRVIIPPLTNQILNLFKNSTLAIAIGYPDLVSVSNTTLNNTGQAIEAITMIMAFYLSASLMVLLFMNWFNHKMRIVER